MMDDDAGLFPNDEKLGTIARAVYLVRANRAIRLAVQATLLPYLIRGIGWLLLAISPPVPKWLHRSVRGRPSWAGFWWGAGLSFFFCFVVTSIWSYCDGTFAGADSKRIYFSYDFPNLIDYAFLCPAYVGLSVQFLVLVVFSWRRLAEPSGLIVRRTARLPHAPLGWSIGVILSVTTFFTISFTRDVLNPKKFPMTGWWVERFAVNPRVLSPLGVYYVLLNFVLQSICVMAAVVFVSFLFLSVEFGRTVASQPLTNRIGFESVCKNLSEFTETYVVMKMLAIALVLNLYTWKHEIPSGSTGFFAFNAAMVVFGVFLISIPRYYIEFEWFRFRVRRALHDNLPDNYERDDIRPYHARVVAWAADSLVLSSFFV